MRSGSTPSPNPNPNPNPNPTPSRRGHAPGFLVPRDVGQGKFHLLENIRALPTHETIPMWWTASGFLCALLVMNLVW